MSISRNLATVCGAAIMAAAGLVSDGAHASSCAVQYGDVAVGGLNPVATIHSLATLGVPTNTTTLAATCRSRFYLHWVGWVVLTMQERAAIAAAATGNGGRISLETDFLSSVVTGKPVQLLATAPITTPSTLVNPISNPNTNYTFATLFANWHLGVDEVHLNGFQDSCLTPAQNQVQLGEFKSIIDQYHAAGVHLVSVDFAPNNWGYGGCNVNGNFSDPAWTYVKAAAQYGGGLTLDVPPYYFLEQQWGYQQFVEEEIAWAKANKVRVTIIVSPPPDDTVYQNAWSQGVQAFIQRLENDSNGVGTYFPDAWVVEDYNPYQDPSDPNVLGDEAATDGITSVALWVAQNAPTTENPNIR